MLALQHDAELLPARNAEMQAGDISEISMLILFHVNNATMVLFNDMLGAKFFFAIPILSSEYLNSGFTTAAAHYGIWLVQDNTQYRKTLNTSAIPDGCPSAVLWF